MQGFISVGYFLVNLIFTAILFLLWARLAMRYFRISTIHPVSHAINGLTNPLVNPIDNVIYKKPMARRYDWVCLGLIILVELFKFICIGLVVYQTILPLHFLALFTLADFIIQPCNLLFYMILIRVIMSWINPQWQHPINDVLKVITNPLLVWGRKIIPDISGFDFSPYLILVILKVITLFISASMPLPIL